MADELINLVEYAKGLDDPLASALIEQFAMESDVLQTISFKSAPQGRNPFSRETELPSMAFRGLNEDPEISHGEIEELQDQCYPISGLLELDRVKRIRYGERRLNQDMKGQMKRGAAIWTSTFINGDNGTEPREFDGLQKRLVADSAGNVDGSTDDSRLLANDTASGGGPLSLKQLDLAISLVNGASHLLMSRRMKNKFIAVARDRTISGFVTHDKNEMGQRITRYGDLPILTGYEPSKHDLFLPFNEVGQGGGGAVTTSIYICSFREDGVSGIQTESPDIIDIGNTDRGIHERNLFEWDVGITIEDFYSALRLSSITDADIVV